MEKLHLSNPLLTNLYKNHLVVVENQETTPATPSQSKSEINYKGGYEKKILWLHCEPAAPFIGEDDFEMLTKILEASRLAWNDIALVNLTDETLKNEVITRLNPLCMIDSTEVTAKEWYAVGEKENTRTLYTHSLKEIRNDKNLKISLWNALKVLFNLQ
jgi:hypothetical protein